MITHKTVLSSDQRGVIVTLKNLSETKILPKASQEHAQKNTHNCMIKKSQEGCYILNQIKYNTLP